MTINLPIEIKGTVLHGKKLGRKIDMPTANLPLPDIFASIPHGVYYSTLLIDGKIYKGISNVGTKPTVKDSTDVNLETFIYDFDGDLYEKEITVTLLEFRRPERKFNSFEELSKEMHRDLEAGRLY